MKRLLLLFSLLLTCLGQSQTYSQPFAAQEPFPYTYNLVRGAARWRDALGRVRDVQPGGSAINYGADVVVAGDSTGTYANIYESWPHFLKVMLQERFNRSGVVGGFGFMPFNTQNSTSNDWNQFNTYTVTCTSANATQGATYTNSLHTFYVTATIAGSTTLVVNGALAPGASGTLSKASGTGDASITFSSFATTNAWSTGHNDTSGKTGLYTTQINPQSPGAKLWRYFDPTTAAGVFQRQGFTSFEFVGTGGFGAPNYNQHFEDTSTSNGPIFPPSNTVVDNTSSYGAHFTRQTGFTATVAHTVQFGSDPNYKIDAGGIILYNGDENEGVRLQNLSSVGSDTGSWNGAAGANHYQANYDQFCTGANGGARNCKLLLINLILNDVGQTSANISAATYQSNLQAIITHVTGLASRPCVGLIINQPWDLASSNATQLALYPSYRNACYALAAANPDTVFVIDLWKTLTDAQNTYFFKVSGVTTSPTLGATYTNNGVTFTVTGTNTGTFAKTYVTATGLGAPSASGTLTKTVGTGDATVTFSAYTPGQTGGYANSGPNSAGGALFDRGWYNDGTHLLGTGNNARAWKIFSPLAWGIS